MSDSLILTLGHNSSAIAVRDGQILGGYETERFTGKKSDSAYPARPVEELMKRFKLDHGADVYFGHWFLNAEMPAQSNKYMDYEHLKRHLNGLGSWNSLDKEFTHHDSHVQSAMVFAGDDFAPTYHAFVLDGFGSFGECISVYEVTGQSYKLLNRWFGYEKSLGMLYQYATAYMGMKQHNHEYKILAYEVHAGLHHNSESIRDYAYDAASKHVRSLIKDDMKSAYDPMISLEALPKTQLEISNILDRFCDDFSVDKTNEIEFRSAVSLYVQTFVEAVALTIVQMYSPTDVLLAGGLFYNVKINSLIQKSIPGRICVMPLAGDQGAGLGVYQHYNGDLTWPGHLNWGPRNLNFKSQHDGLIVCQPWEAKTIIENELSRIGFVNVVRGNMEFGPRALCNTTTLAVPESEICSIINNANGRTTEMPMAPVMSRDMANELFIDCDKVHKSLEYMIIARDYKAECAGSYGGAAHYYPDQDLYTGRPQITDDELMLEILGSEHTGENVLVNTSFNYHGVPIVLGQAEIEYSHTMQRSREPSYNIKTVVITEE